MGIGFEDWRTVGSDKRMMHRYQGINIDIKGDLSRWKVFSWSFRRDFVGFVPRMFSRCLINEGF